jgi:hypothetical protein
MDHTEYIRNWRKTPNGKKSTTFVNWRRGGLVGDYEKIYERYINTENCDLCNVFLEGRGGNKKCMEHDHDTGNFRNITCSRCNTSKTDRKKQKNNTTGYKNIFLNKKNKLWIYRKQYQGRIIKIMRKNKIDILCIKFCGMLLFRK